MTDVKAGARKKPVRLHIDLPPVKDKAEVLEQQRAATPQDGIRDDLEHDIPPVIRSVLELTHLMMSGHSQWLRATPGYQGGLFYRGRPYCFASGYRDGHRPLDVEDKGNHMKLKDPLVYGPMSLPITAAYLCELHGKGVFDLERPLVEYLPDMQDRMDPAVTARSVLSFTTVLDERRIFRDARVRLWRPYTAYNACRAAQTHLYEPLNAFLAGSSTARLNGREQRHNLMLYLRSSKGAATFLRRPPARATVSHFSVALLIAAVETQLKGQTFEESIRDVFFVPAQAHGAGYGPPKLYRDPNEIFYQPTGLALQHQGFRRPVVASSLANCGPPALNASLNLYAPVEDYGKLLLLSLDTIRDARELLGCPALARPHYDLGVQYVPGTDTLQLLPTWRHGAFFLPAAASFRFSCRHDLGCFGAASCGTRSACLFADNVSRTLQHVFVKHVLQKNVDATAALDLDDPKNETGAEKGNGEAERLGRAVKKQAYTSYFTKQDAHRRF
ncbi:hypothetical protein STCU_00805 [Strigomonas culicis]|uniref:Uncharacterized protein n=1 Tax=Strigomonas culicis TaxID=28005 RepID=S9V4M8_9TRYP|nr:hypothetical protein STCU_08701 [Strigomonas culicis]EPY28475.1 hypothetical protein STCU_05105 [Strigomonas culicis]EPY35999.1 hypothetical protein STCU_00805 [Strigomonas culicis]|eukprot:EPY21093.1 hypothetical protein STCU_08701 [Strigomonas culicis]